MSQIYIACSLSRWAEHNQLRDALVAAGHTLTHDWTEASPWVKAAKAPGADLSAEIAASATVPSRRIAAQADLEGVRTADVVIGLLAKGPSRGTQREIGAAHALAIPVLLHGTEADFSLPYPCAFDDLPSVSRSVLPWVEFVAAAGHLVGLVGGMGSRARRRETLAEIKSLERRTGYHGPTVRKVLKILDEKSGPYEKPSSPRVP